MKNLILFLFPFLVAACANNSNNSPTPSAIAPAQADTVSVLSANEENTDTLVKTEPGTSERNVAPPPEESHFPKVFTTGKLTFNIEDEGQGRSKPLVKIEGSKPHEFSMEFPLEGEVQDAFLLDLNKDGFSELYLAVSGPLDRLILQGFASYRDRSAGEIYVKDSDTRRQAGSDRLFVENDRLIRTFREPGGKIFRLTYELKKGETSFILTPAASID